MSTAMTEERPVDEPLLNPLTALEEILASQHSAATLLAAFGRACRGGLERMVVACGPHRREMTLVQLFRHLRHDGIHPPGSVEVVSAPGVTERERARMGERLPP